MSIVDRSSPIPVYYQVETDLKNRIANGEWAPNGQLPSEAELAHHYDISRVTLRQSLAELEKDGLIFKIRGKGAFLSENSTAFLHNLKYSLVTSNNLEENREDLVAKMIELEKIESPDAEVNKALKLGDDSSVVYFKRLFYFESKPIAIGRSWLPSDLVHNLEKDGLIDNSLSKTMRVRYGLTPVRVDDILETVRPFSDEITLLEASFDTPLILIKGISTLENGRPLEYSNTLWLGDRVRFHFALKNTGESFELTSD